MTTSQLATVQDHDHDNLNSARLNPKNFKGFPILSSLPTDPSLEGKLVGYDNGTDTREIYMMMNGVWRSATSSAIVLGESVQFTASDNLEISADTTRSKDDDAYTKVKQIEIDWGGTIRVKFDLRSDTATWTAYGRIYVNDVAVGTIRSLNTQTFVTYSEDISVDPHDKVQLYIHGGSGTHDAQTRNFRLYFDRAITNDYTIDLN